MATQPKDEKNPVDKAAADAAAADAQKSADAQASLQAAQSDAAAAADAARAAEAVASAAKARAELSAPTANIPAHIETVTDSAGNEVPVHSKVNVTVYDVQIERSPQEKMVAEGVYEWEIDVLRSVHGFDRVHVLDEDGYEIELLNPDPQAEFARLQRKYNRKGEESIVESALPMRERQVADLMGVALGKKKANAPQASLQIDNRKAVKKRSGT